ncbi:MAG: divergent polysaccharide deacetylase family protein [Rhodobacteraceae bacterium]|nr:divergent polysaccharide deacetylase family protein [Paracoccaceae bacterium]
MGRSFVLGLLTGSAVGLVGFSGAVMMLPAAGTMPPASVPVAANPEAAETDVQLAEADTDPAAESPRDASEPAGTEADPEAGTSGEAEGEAQVAAAPAPGEEGPGEEEPGESEPERPAAAPAPDMLPVEPEAPVPAEPETAGSGEETNDGIVVGQTPPQPEAPMPADVSPDAPGTSSAPSPDTSAPAAPEALASGEPVPEGDPVAAGASVATLPPVVEGADAPGALPEAAPSVDTEPPAVQPEPAEIAQGEPAPAPDVQDEPAPAPEAQDEPAPAPDVQDEPAPAPEAPGVVAVAPEAESAPLMPSSGTGGEDDAPEPLPVDEADLGDGGADGGLPPGPRILTIEPSAPIGVAGAPKPGFDNGVAGVRVGRLPRIGDAAPAAEPGGTAEPAPAGPGASDGTAAAHYAYPFENPDGAPVVGVILLDDGSADEVPAPEVLGTLGLHVTVAIDPTAPDAATRAQTYRLSGQDVAILVPSLPADATASDFEVAYQAYVAALPDSVAVIAEPDAALNRDRRMAQHLVALLGVDGRGLITYDKGLNPGRQAAAAAGLPTAGVFRVLDGNNETAAAIRRILDRAAFEADRSGQVLVLGHLSTVTVDALADWVAAGAKGGLIAPASALLAAAE